MGRRASLSPRHRKLLLDENSQAETAVSLQTNVTVHGHVHKPEEVLCLLRANASLVAKQQELIAKVDELKHSIQLLWRRGRHAPTHAPSELRRWASDAQQQCAREREQAEDERRAASSSLDEALRARSDAFVAVQSLHEANLELERATSSMDEHHSCRASDMSRCMRDLAEQLQLEQMRRGGLTGELEHLQATRSADVGGLVGKLELLRAQTREELERGKAEIDDLRNDLDEARHQLVAFSSSSGHEHAVLRDAARRQAEAAAQSRQLTADAHLKTRARSERLSEELVHAQAEGRRLRSELDETRESYSNLADRTRATEEHMSKEMVRLNGVVARLGGEKAEDRSVLLARIEALTSERERQVGALVQSMEQSEARRSTESRQLKRELYIMRRLQLKCLDGGAVAPGRRRSILYDEARAEAQSMGEEGVPSDRHRGRRVSQPMSSTAAAGAGVSDSARAGASAWAAQERHEARVWDVDLHGDRLHGHHDWHGEAGAGPRARTHMDELGASALRGHVRPDGSMITPGGAVLAWPESWAREPA